MTANPFPEAKCPVDAVGVNCIVQEMQVTEKTSGGLYIPQMSQERDKYMMTKAKVVSIGEMAFRDQVTHQEIVGREFDEGDIVMLPPFASQKFEHDGVSFRVIHYTEVVGKIDPESGLV